MAVRSVVVQHDVQVSTWVGLRHTLEEAQELLVPVPIEDLVGDAPGRDLERSEERRRPVADVVVRGSFRQSGPDRQDRLAALQRLDLALLVDAQHDRALGRVQ